MKKFDRIYVEITNICNLKCEFCIDDNRKKEFMSIENFKTVISKIKNYTNLIMLHIKGEPLLHPKLSEILEVCFENGILVNITTNATLLNKNIEVIAYSKSVRQINLSMHAFSQNCLPIIENVRKIVINVNKIKAKNENIIISYRLWNIENIEKNDINIELLKYLGSEYKIENIIEKSKNNSFIKLDNKVYLNQDKEFEWPDIFREIINKNGKCYGLRKQIGILVNGDVVPCCLDQNGDINLGNIFENNLNEILLSDRAKEIIKGFEKRQLVEPLCQRCGFVNKRL